MATVFSLAGITFNNGPDGNGVEWVADVPEGWAAAESGVKVIDKVSSDGAIVVQRRLAARVLTVNATATAPSNTALWLARNQLEAAVDGLASSAGTLQVTEPGGVKSLTVYYQGRLKVDMRSPAHFTFQLPLVAPNPAKT